VTTTGHKGTGQRRARSTKRARTSPKAIERAELRKKALELRKAARPVREIAVKIGRSKSETQRLIDEALRDVGPDHETKVRVRTLQLERIDTMVLGLWMRAKKGDEKAVTAVLKLEERRAKIVGSDAPTESKLRLTVTGQLNWMLDIVREVLGDDAAQRVYRRIAETTSAGETPADDDEEA
jgi:hypothetical protein